jgi:ATP-dependent Clp protease ATP-binding subunit ClpC
MAKTLTIFQRYTDNAKRAIYFARYSAIDQRRHFINPSHLLLGTLLEMERNSRSKLISDQESKDIRKLLTKTDEPAITDETTFRKKKWVPNWIWRKVAVPHGEAAVFFDVPLDNLSKRVLARAVEEANKSGSQANIECEHLLLGLLTESQTAVETLKQFAVDRSRVLSALESRRQNPGA